jgi:DNA-binding NtrC family response regulator
MMGDPGGGRLLVSLTEPAAEPMRAACVALLQSANHLVHSSTSLDAAVADLASASYEVAIFAVPEGRAGHRAVASLLGWLPDLMPVVLVGVPAGPVARGLILAGACLTLEWPVHAEQLERAVARALRYCRALRREARLEPDKPLSLLLGVSDEIREIEKLVARAAPTHSPVLVIGEPGSGKHIVAHALHAQSRAPRREGPFIRCLLSGIDPSSLQEDLYGTAARPGVFERANGGTLFMEDITLLPLPEQARLVDLLARGAGAAVTRADGSATVPADLRLVAGAAGDLEESTRQGRLLQDLLYRVNVLPIRIPPLRQRLPDIPALAVALLDRYSARLGRTIAGLSPRATAILQRYSWPGNIRELEEHIERAARRAPGAIVEPEDLAELAHMTAGRPEAAPIGTIDVQLSIAESLPLAEITRRAAVAAELTAIRRALKITDGNVTRAARLLAVSRIHLQKRMKKLGLRSSPLNAPASDPEPRSRR